MQKFGLLLFNGLLATSAAIGSATAQGAREVVLKLEEQDLDNALRTIGRLTKRDIIIAADAAAGKRTKPLVGKLTADEAIRRLLAGTGLVADFRADVVLIRSPIAAVDPAGVSDDVVVTGTRIRGTGSPSRVLILDERSLRDSGKADLGEVARTIPQNFNGGQNPEIGTGVPGNNQNVDASSALNLRGLGPDATLTLLNGHRLAFDGSAQAVDLSALPLAAVDRIEIVPDGASSLYGSDAVGGVANVILKKDFRGAAATARVDLPTEGGGTQQRYTLTAGGVWEGGGALASYNFDRNDAISAGQRRVAAALAPSTTLLREQSHHAIVASLHQLLGPAARLEIDALYSARRSFGSTPYGTNGAAKDFGNTNASITQSFAVAPQLSLDVGSDWQAALHGVYSSSRVRYDTVGYVDGAISARYYGCACNELGSLEAGAEGSVLDLPGGALRLALGAGVRNSTLHFTQGGDLGTIDFARKRVTTFGYAEASLPLITTANARAGIRRLSLSIAGRYEHYAGDNGVLSPRIGAIWAPTEAIDVKGSWGRSFKAPTLFQQYSPGFLTVLNATDLGYENYPAGATVGIVNGGNASLRPERARTWSATLDVHPPRWAGLRLTIGYFDIVFDNRVQVPVQSLFNALGNPIYDPFIVYAPTAAQVGGIVAGASGGLDNATGRPFDPTELVAVIDAGNRNVTQERAAGVDVGASYIAGSGARSTALSVDASWLTSSRIVIPAAPSVRLAGTIFNPPRLRIRGGISWTDGRLSLATFVNRIGSVADERTEDRIRIAGQTTVDVTARFRLAQGGTFNGTEIALAIGNAFNAMPAPIPTTFAYATPYDTTNYSAIGRTIGMQLSQPF